MHEVPEVVQDTGVLGRGANQNQADHRPLARVGDPPPRPQSLGPDAESGRGLALVDAFADRWGVASGPPPRKTVWAEIELLPPEPSEPCSGAARALPQGTREGKDPTKPHPSLPLAETAATAQTHSRE